MQGSSTPKNNPLYRDIIKYCLEKTPLEALTAAFPAAGKDELEKSVKDIIAGLQEKEAGVFHVFVDGASRGNPGHGACAAVFKNAAGETVFELSRYLGTVTNNQAEYTGLISALEKARELRLDRVEVFMDSKLVVEQVKGNYRVNNSELARLLSEVRKVKTHFSSFSISHIPRERNSEADMLAQNELSHRIKE